MDKKIFALTLAILMTALCFFGCGKENTDAETTTEAPEETTAANILSGDRNPLTGKSGYSGVNAGGKMIGIVVENSPDARPQWGMSTPDIVMEYEVEGGISRMLWLYADANYIPEKVGPVRSARHDIVELALGFDMLFVHCGQSYIARDLMAAHPELTEIDGMKSYDFFKRDTTRNTASEHRLCLLGKTFAAELASLGKDLTVEEGKKFPFRFEDENSGRELTGGECSEIKFSYSGNYNFVFTRNAASGLYECALNGKPRTDDSGAVCAYSNVIILYTDMTDMGDKDHHQDLLLEKGGRGVYVNGGRYEEITWQKTQTQIRA